MVFDDKPDLIVEVDTKQAKLNTLEEFYCRVVKEITFNHNIGAIGKATSDYVVKEAMKPIIQGNKIVGNVIHIDNFGNAITNIKKEDVLRFSENKQLRINYRKDDYIDRIVKDYSDVPTSYSLARFNGIDYLELCINCGHAADLLGLAVGDAVQILLE